MILPQIISGILSITSSLTQQQTNGASVLGTLAAPILPKYLSVSGNQVLPWASRTVFNSNPYTDAPDTGMTRVYNLTISRIKVSPDGYERTALLVNGAFPGPTIEANWGDKLQITVNNQIEGPEEGTSLHWHGLLQTGTPWSDGVPSVQQCPIAPGSSHTYTFTASLYGTTWYHSHYSSQYAGGLWGSMVIYGPSDNVDYDIDLGPVALTDYYHRHYFDILETVISNKSNANPAPKSDNNLINGKGNFNCSLMAVQKRSSCNSNAGISKFKFTTGKTHRLRLINAGAEAIQRFSIDGHTMTVFANDFVPIQPYNTTVVTLGVGQRTDVLVTADAGNSASSFYMRSIISTICSLTTQPYALAAIYYDEANTTATPQSTPWDVPDPGTCANDDLSMTIPSYPLTPDMFPATTREMDVDFYVNETGFFLWTLDGTSQRGNFNSPILLLASKNSSPAYDPIWNVKDFGSNKTIRVIVNNLTPVAHPMHLHGHNMFILSEGTGTWDGTITHPTNPQRRDVQMLRPNGYLAWQIDADNPGVWPFHCHIAWHSSGGLYANILERPDKIKGMDVEGFVGDTCVRWVAWENRPNIVDQIDSGV